MFSGSGLFGLNLMSLVGLVMTALGLSFARAAPGRRTFGIALMGVGTVLVFAGLYLTDHPL
jgi:hypothetical protein